ncbi:hypothetical protein EXIGLDRAFT_726027 [Exidia glandulosa HHB12029]|uniref:tRNA-splicing endonuclease subunit Sen2 n=1 Tax=Exidia glandulosa HHB12029 TaxID=1314781 RepID=A0A165ZSJ4_EXIGL|nr:hypothetical protein EXIGLDRAFT_726027 [Exidia glandulosa HHB12029]
MAEQTKAGKKNDRAERNRIYAHALPAIPSSSTKPWLGIPLWRTPSSLERPRVVGVFDSATRSVWIIHSEHANLLWRRGFFGKGSLSRSEPTWLARQTGSRTAEEITAKRREERKTFKTERARAIVAAQEEAEAAFAAGKPLPAPFAPEAVRQAIRSTPEPGDASTPPPVLAAEPPEIEPVEDLEYLQLTLQEAFFLAWSLDSLRVLDAVTHNPLSLPALWRASHAAHYMPPAPQLDLRFDNPFLVNYVAYHHYRSLGWVVKSGIKFCADLLLYKRGPVFAHAEFAVIVCPVYEDDTDRATSPFQLSNVDPFSWSWLSTVGRVNSQVQKTLILTYVTIPSSRRVNLAALDSPGCLAEFSVREVVLRRWVPARMRD